MKIPEFIRQRLLGFAGKVMADRYPDFRIAPHDELYMERWHLIKTRWLGVYIHRMVHDDDDRALHDHPGHNISLVLHGCYIEYLDDGRKLRGTGDIVFRHAATKHRLELIVSGRPVTTIWIRLPSYREWGFWPNGRFVPWHEFVDARDPGRIREEWRNAKEA